MILGFDGAIDENMYTAISPSGSRYVVIREVTKRLVVERYVNF